MGGVRGPAKYSHKVLDSTVLYLGLPNNVKEPVAGRACLSTSSDIPAWIDCTDFAYLYLMDVATRVYIFQYMS